MDPEKRTLLDSINSPADLKKLDAEELIKVSDELRQFIIDMVCSNPGHLGANLGVVELTVALHYVYNTPYDQLIWDVGHQAYAHKILTGRRDIFHTNRKLGGISGFPKMDESEFDAFGVGHSSTSISAALGIAVASKQAGENRKVVAVIGDGSLTGGLAFEGLNNAGFIGSDILVVLNDNHMAIDPNVGALQEYFLKLTTSKTYNRIKNKVWNFLGKLGKKGPTPQRIVQQINNAAKGAILEHSNLFEAMKFRYFGPVDGHDVVHLTKVLEGLKSIPGPKLLHVITKKGKGYIYAEENQTVFHAPGKFDKATGKLIKKEFDSPQPPKYQDVFGHTLVELADNNPKIIGITPAMISGCSMRYFFEKYPDRAFDVGIAEQHAVTFAAGLAAKGAVPFCNVYSSFMQRAFDSVIHDIAIQNLPVILCLDRAGLVGEDGATHHGAYDMAYLRCIPNLIIASPVNEEELRNLMYTAQLNLPGPMVIRYPKGQGVMSNWQKPFQEITIGTGQMLCEGYDMAILTIGPVGNIALEATLALLREDIHAAVYDMRFLKPLDTDLLHDIFKNHSLVLTVEDGAISGGFGSAIVEFMTDHNYTARIKRIGIPDNFIPHGTQQELYKLCGIDMQGIVKSAKELISNNQTVYVNKHY
jgi:1-deoxy-D-xylulose-5-phosphate synthase